MRIKSYYANSVEDGIGMARTELGPDAMLVSSRRTSPETRHLGDYEVVIVTDLAAAAEVASPLTALPASGGPARRGAPVCSPTPIICVTMPGNTFVSFKGSDRFRPASRALRTSN